MANLKDILAKVKTGMKDVGVNIPTSGGGTSSLTGSRISSTYRMPPGSSEAVIRTSTTTPGKIRAGTMLNVTDSFKKNVLGMKPNELVINVEELGLDKFKSARVPPFGTEFVDIKPFRPSDTTFKEFYTDVFTKDLIRDPKDLAEIKGFNAQTFLKDMNEAGDLTKIKGGTAMGYKTYSKDMLDDVARLRGYVFALPGKIEGQKTQSLDRFIGQQLDAIDVTQASDIKFAPLIEELKKSDPKKYKILSKNFGKERIKFAMESVVDGASVDAVMEAKKELGDKFDFNSSATKRVIASNFKTLLRGALWGPMGVMAVITEGLAGEDLNPTDDSLSTKQRIERGEVYTVDEQTQRDFYRDNPEVASLIREGVDLSPKIQGMDPLGLFNPSSAYNKQKDGINFPVDKKQETGIMTIDEKFK
jgi:hypothetical protein